MLLRYKGITFAELATKSRILAAKEGALEPDSGLLQLALPASWSDGGPYPLFESRITPPVRIGSTPASEYL